MKNKIIILMACFVSASANAAYQGPLISMITRTPKVAPGYSKSIYCSIFNNKVVLVYQLEGTTTTQERLVVTSGLSKQIAEAASGKVTSESWLVDIESKSYFAYQVNANDTVTDIDLGSENGGSGTLTTNSSPAAISLKTLADLLCK